MTTGIPTGYIWIAKSDGSALQIVQVSGPPGDDAGQIVETGGGFMSWRRAKELGFEFRQKVADFQEEKRA